MKSISTPAPVNTSTHRRGGVTWNDLLRGFWRSHVRWVRVREAQGIKVCSVFHQLSLSSITVVVTTGSTVVYKASLLLHTYGVYISMRYCRYMELPSSLVSVGLRFPKHSFKDSHCRGHMRKSALGDMSI